MDDEELTPEQLALIAKKRAALSAGYEDFVKRQTEAKIQDVLMAGACATREEAIIALAHCNEDELLAVQELMTNPKFKERVADLASGRAVVEPPSSAGGEDEDYSEEDDEDSELDDGAYANGNRNRSRRRRVKITLRNHSTAADASDDETPEEKAARAARRRAAASAPPKEGYNMDGSRRAPTIRLHEALQRLAEIKKKEAAAAEAVAAAASSSASSSSSSSGTTSSSSSSTESNGSTGKTTTTTTSPTKKKEEEKKTEKSSSSSATTTKKRRGSLGVSSASSKGKKDDEEKEEEDAFETKPVAEKKSRTVRGKETSAVKSSTSSSSNASPAAAEEEEVEYTFEELKRLDWSDARIKAFLQRKTNPNAYYYRFNAPGEEQATGAWTKEEHDKFMELIADGVDYRWGVLSMSIPGRVGYQCSNYYRKLIQDGVVVDPNYTIDAEGKLVFSRPKGASRGERVKFDMGTGEVKRSAQSSSSSGGSTSRRRSSGSSSSSRRSAKRRKRSSSSYDSEDDDDDEYSSGSSSSESSSSEDDGEEEGKMMVEEKGEEGGNSSSSSSSSSKAVGGSTSTTKKKKPKRVILFPEMRDAMTLKQIKEPAISPHGYVLEYMTWLRILSSEPKNTCPFTKQRVTRRDLVKLTPANVEEYRSKIVNYQGNTENNENLKSAIDNVVATEQHQLQQQHRGQVAASSSATTGDMSKLDASVPTYDAADDDDEPPHLSIGKEGANETTMAVEVA